MLVSPTEQRLKGLGKSSSLPERYGADFLFASINGLVGVQRKALKDLVASLHDGRFAKELGQMGGLAGAILLIEGEARWSSSGQMMGIRAEFTVSHLLGVLLSVQSKGIWVIQTASLDETRLVLPLVEKWVGKHRHGSLMHRPNPQGEWGHVGNRDWGVHLLQSFNGMGYGTSGNVYDHFGCVPIKWAVTKEELMEVKGVGKGRAEALFKALGES